jgi:UPF0755 protein
VLLGGYFYYNLFLHKNSSEITLYFPYGTPVIEIAKQMKEAQVIGDEKTFIIAAKLAQINRKTLISGEYKFATGISPYVAMLKLIRGERVLRKLTIPEGLTVKATMKAINNAPGLLGEITEEVKECNILPETYLYYFGDNKDSIVRAMKSAFKKFTTETMSTNRSGLRDIDSVITLASIVEKETKVAEERPRIAGVYLNRLQVEMPLQADPTIIYGMSNGLGAIGRELTRDDLKINNPYNTYLQKGLPPTAIACPGKASILAVINPEKHDYLYFVADSSGGHVFAKSLSEHNKNNIARKARKQEFTNNSAKKT